MFVFVFVYVCVCVFVSVCDGEEVFAVLPCYTIICPQFSLDMFLLEQKDLSAFMVVLKGCLCNCVSVC